MIFKQTDSVTVFWKGNGLQPLILHFNNAVETIKSNELSTRFRTLRSASKLGKDIGLQKNAERCGEL